MASTADLIREATKKARNDFVDYTIQQERKIYILFEQASNELTAKITKYAVEGKVPPARLVILLDQVKTQMATLRPKLKNFIRSSQRNSIDFGIKSSILGANAVVPSNLKVGIGSSFIDAAGKVHRYDPTKELYAASTWARINGNAMDALIRTNYGGITFSRRVWDVMWPVERQIRNQINLAVLTGKSASSVARNIRSYMGMPETFRGMAFKDFHPGAGVYKSAYKNALRLSGTEINRAYNEGIMRYGKSKKWITGYIWRTGSGDPCPDCLDVEGEFYLKDGPAAIPLHPFCYCWLQIVYEGE